MAILRNNPDKDNEEAGLPAMTAPKIPAHQTMFMGLEAARMKPEKKCLLPIGDA